jgi:hypothetical protein
MWIRRQTFEEHARRDTEQFQFLTDAQAAHDKNVEAKHVENKEHMDRIEAKVDDIVKLKPDLEAGILSDQARAYRRKRIKTVFWSAVSTLVFISGMIPLVQIIAGFHFSIKFTGVGQ